MGNVVSSVLMYALQVAWFCQRLIDQDYRQNHGSRPRPIMGTDETDLDVFLSKCRSYYYLADGRNQHRRRFVRNEKNKRAEHFKKKRKHYRNGSQTAICMQHEQCPSGRADWEYLECDCSAPRFDEGTDDKYASRTALTCPPTNNNETDAVDIFSSRRRLHEFSKSDDLNDLERERHDLDSPEREGWKRKKFFFGKPLRESADASESECEISSIADSDSFSLVGCERFDRPQQSMMKISPILIDQIREI